MVYEPLFVLLFSQGDFGLDGAAGYSGPVGMRVSDFPLTRKISVQKPFSRKKLCGHAANQHFKIQLHLWNGGADPSSKLSS